MLLTPEIRFLSCILLLQDMSNSLLHSVGVGTSQISDKALKVASAEQGKIISHESPLLGLYTSPLIRFASKTKEGMHRGLPLYNKK